jgi:hypothetical protein
MSSQIRVPCRAPLSPRRRVTSRGPQRLNLPLHWPPVRFSLLVPILVIVPSLCSAATTPPPPTPTLGRPSPVPTSELPDNFLGLRDKREALEKEIPKLRADIDDLTAKLKERRRLQRALDDYHRQRDAAKGNAPAQAFFERQIRQVNASLADFDSEDSLLTQIATKEALLETDTSEKSRVEIGMSQLIDIEKPRQDFKKTMSITFAVLVGLVIVGFFVVATADEVVRREIFGAQSGIQFLTLFSLVIAIILFGITGVLEGKELAALLGGLSGYILGRVTASRSGTNGRAG